MYCVDVVPPPEQGSQEDVYLVLPLMETDLHRIIYSKQSLSDQHVQFFVYQLLVALKYLHSGHIIHRDIKPSNILVNSNCLIKISDYGLARSSEETQELTEYVVTRWYRAPEIMLSTRHYGPAVDVWAVGCVLGELLGRRCLFAGEDYMEQLKLIVELLGSPQESELEFITSSRAREFIMKIPWKDSKPLEALFPSANPAGLDLLKGLLQFSPQKRLTVDQALEHPYLSALHSTDPAYEPVYSGSYDFSLSGLSNAPVEDIRMALWNVLRLFWPTLPTTSPSRVSSTTPPPPPPKGKGGVGGGGGGGGGNPKIFFL